MKKIIKRVSMVMAMILISCTSIMFVGCGEDDETHTHELTETARVEATCETDGNIQYWYCEECGKYFSDADAKNVITLADTVIPATGHSYTLTGWTWTEENTATATFACSEGDDTQTVDATVTSETTAATCAETGKIVYTATATFNGSTYTDNKEVTIPATGHTAAHMVATAATCTTAGNIEYYYCSTCGKYFSDEACTNEITGSVTISATGHSYGTTLTYSDGSWYKTCTVCEGSLNNGNVEVTDDYTDYTFLADSAEALSSALTLGGSIKLTANISGSASYEVPSTAAATLDLNGYTITLNKNQEILIKGTLTVNESNNGGVTIADGVTKTSLFVVNGGTLTLNGGIYSNSAYYGIYCQYDGTAIINDGTIAGSQYSALSGNNTTGNMNFVINGGTISASKGPAIYMSGQGNLTVTGGTINGGISLRMGIANITGGTINSITENIDKITDEYKTNGNVWLADAIFVMAGTYTSTDETNGNKLVLSISGDAQINCTNGSGSAVAIYDLGKVSQSVTVNITGGTLTTNSETRLPYQVLSLDDMGINDSNYGTYSGNVVSNINVSTADELANAVSSGSGTTNITLTDDIVLTETIAVTSTINLDMNGKTISNTTDIWNDKTDDWSFFSVRAGGYLTVTGNGMEQCKQRQMIAMQLT